MISLHLQSDWLGEPQDESLSCLVTEFDSDTSSGVAIGVTEDGYLKLWSFDGDVSGYGEPETLTIEQASSSMSPQLLKELKLLTSALSVSIRT